jgi:hypothetical protein
MSRVEHETRVGDRLRLLADSGIALRSGLSPDAPLHDAGVVGICGGNVRVEASRLGRTTVVAEARHR